MKLSKKGLGRPRQVYGIDFSGAANAGKKIWLASGRIKGHKLLIEDCRRAETLPGSGKDRGNCLAALRNFIKKEIKGAFGLDFPFGLPKPLVKHRSWEEFVIAFSSLYKSPEDFKKACYSAAGGRELKRATDIESKTPFSPYNLRLYRQTFFGISKVISPLVHENLVCVLPMQKAMPEKPWIFEICPDSTLKTTNLYSPFKGRTDWHREVRSRILEKIERMGGIRLQSQNIRTEIVEDRWGGALDSVIAAWATFNAFRNRASFPSDGKSLYTIEGYVYV